MEIDVNILEHFNGKFDKGNGLQFLLDSLSNLNSEIKIFILEDLKRTH